MRKFIFTLQAGAVLLGLAACDKKPAYEADAKDAVAHITVVDDKGSPQVGAVVMIFDEKGYEKFQQDRKTEPLGVTLTLRNGQVSYRLPYQQWFTAGSRLVTFVVMEEADEENYHIWSVSRTVKAAEQVKVDFKLDRTPTGSGESGVTEDVKEPGENEVSENPDSPTDSVGTLFEMFDQENGHTLFGEALFLDSDLGFDGGGRYTIVDAGMVQSLKELNALSFDRAARRISAWPGHGYFICKDISLMEFPSGKRAMAIGSEYAKIRVAEWIVRDEKKIGVKFNYTYDKIKADGLPEWGKVYDVKLAGDKTIEIPLPANSSDSECAPWGKAPLRISFANDHATIQITDEKAAAGNEYRFVIRAGAGYTEAKLRLVE